MTGMKKVSARPLSTKKSNAAKNSKDSNNTKKTKSKQNEKTPLKMGKFDGGTLRISQKEVAKMRKQSKIATARTMANIFFKRNQMKIFMFIACFFFEKREKNSSFF